MSGFKEACGKVNTEEPSHQIVNSFEWRFNKLNDYAWVNKESPNFYPGGSTGEWRLYFKKCPNREIINAFFYAANSDIVPVKLYFLIAGESYDLALTTKCSEKLFEIANFQLRKIISWYYNKENVVYVKWHVEGYINNDELPKDLINDYYSLLTSGKFSDIEIETEDGTFEAHQNILAARSPVFCAMLESNMLESRTKCIKIVDFSTETVKDMIAYMYTSRLPPFTCDSASELLKAADRYGLVRLKRVCADSLLLHLTVTNASKILLLADVYSEDSLKQKVLDFISENRSAFTDPSKFDESIKQRPNLLVEVINSIAKC